ncbi:SMP-30/gluconolactonase/LRE family protein [Lentzea sp. NPDC051208]|uniref:SMP-30/gluconolactonase/LRE family protein n=1 Tax=Lentzea sp. NPDC051208 TaxID=3154642 RepID=UPI00343D71E0
MSLDIGVLTPHRYAHGESPRWDLAAGRLLWVDMAAGNLHCAVLTQSGLVNHETFPVARRIGCPAPVEGAPDRWIVAAAGGFREVTASGTVEVIGNDPAPAWAWMNDGGCDPTGRFWAGTQCAPRSPACCLYSLEVTGAIITRLTGVTVSNGLCFSEDGRTMYYIDTLPHRSIEAFDVSSNGELSGRRVVSQVDGGNPDGLAIDVEGNLWVAVWDAAQIRRYTPTGRLLTTIDLPASRPTAVTFAGSLLIITTASAGLVDPGPLDGALLCVDVDVAGPPAAPYRRLSDSDCVE